MDQLIESIPAAAWVVIGGVATKLVEWVLAYRRGENDRIAKTYDAVNTAQKALTDSLFQQISQLRTELAEVRQQNHDLNERYQTALSRIADMEATINQLRERLE